MKRIILLVLSLLIVGLIKNNINIVYADDDPNENYLRFTVTEGEGATLTLKKVGNVSSLDDNALFYSIVSNGLFGEWNEVVFNESECLISGLNYNDNVCFKRDDSGTFSFSSENAYYTFASSEGSTIEVSGDVTTLINGNGNVSDLSVNNNLNYCFNSLFKDSNFKFNNLVLPSTQLSAGCYYRMFEDCENLQNAPELPATTMKTYCYAYMFDGCSNLTTPPELPALDLAPFCYRGMFAAFTKPNGITTAPELPATTLESYCYSQMFASSQQDGSIITVGPKLPATTLAPYCYEEMFACVNSSGNSVVPNANNLKIAPDLPATSLDEACYHEMFAGCQKLEIAPELPATNLVPFCYNEMFKYCTSLKVPPELPIASLSNMCCVQMFANSGISISDTSSEPHTIFYRIPSGENTISSYDETYMSQMFYGCSSSSTLVNGTPSVSGSSISLYLKNVPLTISFDGNGDNVSNVPTAQSKQPFEEITLPTASSISKSGYTLKGWSLRQDGKDNFYLPGASVKARGDMKFYAIWEENNNDNDDENPSSPSSEDSTSNRHIVLNTSVN